LNSGLTYPDRHQTADAGKHHVDQDQQRPFKSETHPAGCSRSVVSGTFDAVNDNGVDGTTGGVHLQSQLLLHSEEQSGLGRIRRPGWQLASELIIRPQSKVTVQSQFDSLRLTSPNDLWYSGGGVYQAWTFGFTGQRLRWHGVRSPIFMTRAWSIAPIAAQPSPGLECRHGSGDREAGRPFRCGP